MAKIIVTRLLGNETQEELVDTNSIFKKEGDHTWVVGADGRLVGVVVESLGEIQKRINEIEKGSTNLRLDLILRNQQELLKKTQAIWEYLLEH